MKVKRILKASYNVEEKNVNGNIWTFKAYVNKNKKGNNIMSATFDYVNEGKQQYLKETYHLVMYNKDKKKGEIICTGLYPDGGSGGIVSSSIQHFTVTGAWGICQDSSHVVIDFRDKIRKVYVYVNVKND